MMDVKDPVCGMTVKVEGSVFTSSFKGETYYFCSEKCRAEFDEGPDAVLAMKSEREKSVERERSVSLEKMIDAVAHEIRNPLTSIGGFARKIYRSLSQDDPNRDYMKMIIDDVARVENMIRQIVELKTMGVLHPKPSDINKIVSEAVRSFEKELTDRNIEFEVELMDKPPLALLDGGSILKTINHLIRNSIEAMEKAPGKLKISTFIRNEAIEVTVSDTGKGIPEDKIKFIFDPLFTSKIYGPGLGLTFDKMIIQEHGGSISVMSEPGKGTVFTIRLPLKG